MTNKSFKIEMFYEQETGEYTKQRFIFDEDPQPPDPPVPTPNGAQEWTTFVPKWRVGGSGGLYASPNPQGWYKETPVTLVIGDNKVPASEIEVFIELEMDSPNIPAGEGMEFEFPAFLTPNSPRTGRGSAGDLWIEGGANHYSVAGKWTDRNSRPMRVIVVLGNGHEWTRNDPKEVVKGSLYLWMKYLK